MLGSECFLVLALICMIVNVVISILIVVELDRRNFKINILLIRLLIPKYVHQYRKVTV